MEEAAGEYLAEVEVEVEEVPSHSFSSSPLDLSSSFSTIAAFWFTAAALFLNHRLPTNEYIP